MIKFFLAWLNAIYIKPGHVAVATRATSDTEPKIKTTKEINVSDITASTIQSSVTAAPSIESVPVAQVAESAVQIVSPAVVVAPVVTAEPVPLPAVSSTLSPLDKAKAEFDKFVAFVEHGIDVLGAGAEADLVALRQKYR